MWTQPYMLTSAAQLQRILMHLVLVEATGEHLALYGDVRAVRLNSDTTRTTGWMA
jgi:hypothetical protein